MTGAGGGALMTPLLLLVFGVSPYTAVATDLWFAGVTKAAAMGVHHVAGLIDWQVARPPDPRARKSPRWRFGCAV